MKKFQIHCMLGEYIHLFVNSSVLQYLLSIGQLEFTYHRRLISFTSSPRYHAPQLW